MNQIEDNLELALHDLASGKPLEQVLARFPENEAELRPLLEVSSLAKSLPRITPPAPMRRRKFLKPAVQLANIWDFKFFLKLSAVPLVFAFALISVKTAGALPGTTLFSLKKAAEQAQIKLADSNEQPLLQIDLAQKRLSEARTVLAESDSSEQKTAALDELHHQTETAIDAAAPVVAAKALSNDSKPLEKLITLNNDVAGLSSANQSHDDAKNLATAVQSNKKKLGSLIATANEVALAPLLKNSDIIVKGPVKIAIDGTITVNNLSFKITDETIIKSDADTANLSASVLVPNTIVNISGIKDNQGEFTATSVVVLAVAEAKAPDPAAGQVKGSTNVLPAKKVEPAPAEDVSEDSEPEASDPNQAPGNFASGSFIPEQPSDNPQP